MSVIDSINVKRVVANFSGHHSVGPIIFNPNSMVFSSLTPFLSYTQNTHPSSLSLYSLQFILLLFLSVFFLKYSSCLLPFALSSIHFLPPFLFLQSDQLVGKNYLFISLAAHQGSLLYVAQQLQQRPASRCVCSSQLLNGQPLCGSQCNYSNTRCKLGGDLLISLVSVS